MSQERKFVTPEICKSVASAIIGRWIHDHREHKKVMELVFKNNTKSAAKDLGEEIYRLL